MGKLTVFNSISLDGYFTDAQNKMDFAKNAPQDTEWNDFVSGNAKGEGALVFGRVTYEMMVAFWTTPAAAEMMPKVAAGMNKMPKLVFSRTLTAAEWKNTRLIQSDLVGEIRKLKEGRENMVILGSGSVVAQLAPHKLIDEYQLVVCPTAIGKGRTLFQGVETPIPLKLASSRAFKNGNVVLTYTA